MKDTLKTREQRKQRELYVAGFLHGYQKGGITGLHPGELLDLAAESYEKYLSRLYAPRANGSPVKAGLTD